MTSWRFSEIVEELRWNSLEGAPPFDRIAEDVAASMKVVCTHTDPCDEQAGFTRLVCCIELSPELFDLFFNARSGYRGSYFTSPEQGVRANGKLLSLVADKLAVHSSHPDLSQSQAEHSLLSHSAKVWLAEVGRGFCPACEGEWTPPQDDVAEILNGRWELKPGVKARYGRKAPYYTKLRVLGAFVNESGAEYVTTQKRHRARDIHEFGWS